MNWEEIYESIPVPESDPCEGCRLAQTCDTICPARAKWWDRQIRGASGGPQNHVSKGHSQNSSGSIKLYTVKNNHTGQILIRRGSASDCAAAMGIQLSSFYSTVHGARKNPGGKWTVESQFADEEVHHEIKRGSS